MSDEKFEKERKERARTIFRALNGMTIDDAHELLKDIDEAVGCFARVDFDAEIEKARKERAASENEIENSSCASKD